MFALLITPFSFELKSIYPNPFNSSTVISYSFDEAANVELRVLDLDGRLIDTVVNRFSDIGNFQVVVLMDSIKALFEKPQFIQFYNANPDSKTVHFNWLVQSTIAHEFGHSIGMKHLPLLNQSLMDSAFQTVQVGIDSYKLDVYQQSFDPTNLNEAAIRAGYPYTAPLDKYERGN